MQIHDLFMRRCIDLARRGASFVSLNQVAGAVIVCKRRIIGEGYSPNPASINAEIQAIQSISQEDIHLIKKSCLYISREPHGLPGETGSAVHQIIMQGIPKVFVCTNPSESNLQGIHALKTAGVKVETGILAPEGLTLYNPQQVVEYFRRPYIILKYARSADGFLGFTDKQVWLSHPWLKRLTHKWRSEAGAIIIGTNTAATDNPRLNTRMYYGSSPIRIVLDRRSRLPLDLNLFDGKHPTWVIQEPGVRSVQSPNCRSIQLKFDQQLIPKLLSKLYEEEIYSLIVEGGAQLINSFLAASLWDEARVYTSERVLGKGIRAPVLQRVPVGAWKISDTYLHQYINWVTGDR